MGSREEGVDFYLFQEAPVLEGERTVSMEGYESVDGMGGYLKGGEGAVVSTKVHERWEGKWEVIKRERTRIGLLLKLGGGRKLEIWNIYVGKGKHRGFEWIEGDGNGVVMGDINAWHERWGGEGVVENVEGRRVVDWMDEWGWKWGTERGVVTRRREKEEGSNRVLDVGLYVGGVEVRGRSWEWIVGLDHRPIEMEVEVIGIVVKKEEDRRGIVDWEKLETSIRLEGEKEEWREGSGSVNRRVDLEGLVERFEGRLMELVEESRGRRKWEKREEEMVE